MRKVLGLVVLLALLLVPTAALAKPGKGKGATPAGVNAKGHGHEASGTEADEADAPDADDQEAPESDAPETNAPDGPSGTHGKSADAKAKAEAKKADHANHIPTGHAQEVLAAKVESGKFSPQATWVFYRILVRMQDAHGAAVTLPAAPPEPAHPGDTETAKAGD